MKKEVKEWLVIITLNAICLIACIYDMTTGQQPTAQPPAEEIMIESTEDVIRWPIDDVEDEPTEITVEELEVEVVEEQRLESLGVYFITAYCACNECTDGDGLTALNKPPVEGRTVAVDPDVIPYGTILVINGHEYVAEDCGGNSIVGKEIDIYYESHEVAKEFGEQWAEVFVKEEADGSY